MSGIAVVTGSSGFIGTHLVRQLVARGYRVRCLVRRGSPARGDEPGIDRHVVDFADAETLRRCAALDGADLVFHLAGVTKALSMEAFRQGNVVPTVNLLRALEQRTVRRVVIVSSQAAAGPAASLGAPTREDDAPRPVEAYGRSKLEAEDEARRFDAVLPLTIVRPCSVYGPGDVDFLALFRMAQHGVVLYPGTRDSYVSLLHVDDVVQGLIDAASAPAASGRTVFLSSQAPARWSDIGEAIGDAAGRRIRSVNVPLALVRATVPFGEAYARLSGRPTLLNRHKVALSAPRYWVCAAERARQLFGFQPRHSLAQGVRNTYCWYVSQGWLPGAGESRPAAPSR